MSINASTLRWRVRVGAVLAAALSAGGAVASGDTLGPGESVGLEGVRVGGDDHATRLVLDLDAAARPRFSANESSPTRMVFVLPPVLSSHALAGAGHGIIDAWCVREEATAAKLVLRVSLGAKVDKHFLIPPDKPGQMWRYVIDLSGADARDAPATPLVSPSPRQSTNAFRTFAKGPAATMSTIGETVASTDPISEVSIRTPLPQPAQVPAAAPPLAPPTPTPPAQRPAPPPPVIAPRALAQGKPAPRPVGRAVRVVVIDAGHGGHDTGAQSLVRNEKDITLAAALALRDRLERIGGYRVVLTRSTDVFIPLEERVRIARRAGADLFISLHADSAGSDPTPHGASVYTISDHGETRVNNVLGPHEWFTHAGTARSDPSVRQLLLDLTQSSTRNRSSQFASVLIDHIGDKVDLLPHTHRDAGYFVLLAPDVPAVLLEMGFITNPSDEMRLTNPAQRGRLMAGVADAIDAYFSGTGPLSRG